MNIYQIPKQKAVVFSNYKYGVKLVFNVWKAQWYFIYLSFLADYNICKLNINTSKYIVATDG
jgi:hypothetical protein